MNRIIYWMALLAVAFSSCSKDEDNSAPAATVSGKNYFPDTDSISRTFLVDSIAWDEFTNSVDTFTYYYKELIAGHFTDNAGRPTQRIEKYLFDSSSGNWIIWKVNYANLTTTTAEVVEDNYRILKLTFPPRLNATWNGNVYNTNEPQTYKITNLHLPESTAWMTFDSTLTVLQQDDFTLIYDRFAEERYAAGKGLYYRYRKDVNTNPSNLQIISGYIYRASLVAFTQP